MRLNRSTVGAGLALALAAAAPVPPRAESLNCDFSRYKSVPGLTAALEQDALVVSWSGQSGSEVRARYAIDAGKPIVRELAVKNARGQWTTLGRNLAPEYHVVSGVRRMATDQANPLRATRLME